MDARLTFWNTRRVLICGCTDQLGSSLAEKFLALGADVSGFTFQTPETDSPFLVNKLFEKITVIRASSSDVPSIASVMSSHEIEVILHGNGRDSRSAYAMLSAARIAVPNAAVVLSIPTPASRILQLANRFRVEQKNPIAVPVLPDDASIEAKVEFMESTARLTVNRDSKVLRGWTELPTERRLAA